MKLPIPEIGPNSSKNMRRFTGAVNQIDRAKFGKEFLKNYKERTPLIKSDFKNLSRKWIFVMNKNGKEKYLMFINNDKSELNEYVKGLAPKGFGLKLYYVEFYYSEIDVGTHYQNLRFDSSDFYYDTIDSILTWANVYSITSIDSHPFMNWTETPWGVK
tara:strand:- start:14453 stop:14929 length:477 start_codon:yes stop_codon:yes gene_type:complete